MIIPDCHRCQDSGFLWLNFDGQVVGPDDPQAVVSFRCHHDGRGRRIRQAFEQWVKTRTEANQ